MFISFLTKISLYLKLSGLKTWDASTDLLDEFCSFLAICNDSQMMIMSCPDQGLPPTHSGPSSSSRAPWPARAWPGRCGQVSWDWSMFFIAVNNTHLWLVQDLRWPAPGWPGSRCRPAPSACTAATATPPTPSWRRPGPIRDSAAGNTWVWQFWHQS